MCVPIRGPVSSVLLFDMAEEVNGLKILHLERMTNDGDSAGRKT